TIIVALWSAGKGVLALTTGLNCVYDCKETRNYIILRIRATFYTVAFIIVIIFLLVLSVFGNTLNLFVTEHYPVMERLVDQT
ncbi:YhjD/YihY/BrkB family envelope integrity protein, partial [Collinsella aerofaciens]|uniref:YhjD/YihY/BrkB family envelope integrity protein n=1 Tax=Collinsella aerofaciens TaxID=74426 RepID=UPI001EDD78AC